MNCSCLPFTCRLSLLLGLMLAVTAPGFARNPASAPVFRELRKFTSPEAHQAAAVDRERFFAIDSRAIASYDKVTGDKVAEFTASKELPLVHLNSGIVIDGKLYCAHSTWPKDPADNTIEVFDAATLKHVQTQKLTGFEGAVTWIDRRGGSWWVGLSKYGTPEEVAKSRVHKLDDDWQSAGAWGFPDAVLKRFAPMSNSGAAWGPDGLLYATGHDHAEMYALSLPDQGSTLELVATVPAAIEGQGLAWDHNDIGIAYGIRRKSKQVVVLRLSHEQEYDPLLRPVTWQRDPENPILPPGPAGAVDATRAMNPWVLRVGDEYRLFYSGGDADGRQRICRATSASGDLHEWSRSGPLFETGKPGTFDARWCVLPHVVQFSPERWHLYYTGNAGKGTGLSSFPGIGLAVSNDGKSWVRHGDEPVLARSNEPGTPDAIGMAGGSLIRGQAEDGSPQWWFFYTGCPTVGQPLPLNQQKTICLAVSDDGINWHKRGPLMVRDPARDYENIAVAGPVVLEQDGLLRMWYSAIGTRWGYYSICYAESDDGLHWRRGRNYGDNLQLTPGEKAWEKQMVEYPSIVVEGSTLRMFYCGNGYGKTGIGMATGTPTGEQPSESGSK